MVGEEGKREDEQRMKRRTVMFRGHTSCFFLINSNVRKNKPVPICPIILYLIRFLLFGAEVETGGSESRAAVLCYVDDRRGHGVPAVPTSLCYEGENKHSPRWLIYTRG